MFHRGPVPVAGRDLRLGHEGDAGIPEIREADGIPRANVIGFLPLQATRKSLFKQ